uniref:(northern house mosquito) hypothetical protein n=1 Tax=Culex pipiens TaxID=7175 RepID=A0A8D8BZT2_CULPI
MEKGIRFVDVGNPAKSGSDDSDSETGQSAGDSNSDADASSDGTSSNEDTAKDSDSEDEESERVSSQSSITSIDGSKENHPPRNITSSDLQNLIVTRWNLGAEVFNVLEGKVKVDTLKLLRESDLQELFGKELMDEKVRLRQKLQTWPASVMFVPPQEGSSKPRKIQLNSSSVRATDLNALLQTNEKGKIVVRYYEQYKTLTKSLRTDLAGVIVDSYIAAGRKFPMPDMGISNSRNVLHPS